MKSILRKGLPLSTFVVVAVLHFAGLRSSACLTCVNNGVWRSCSDAGYMWLITIFYLVPIAVFISAVWWIILWRRDRKRKQSENEHFPK